MPHSNPGSLFLPKGLFFCFLQALRIILFPGSWAWLSHGQPQSVFPEASSALLENVPGWDRRCYQQIPGAASPCWVTFPQPTIPVNLSLISSAPLSNAFRVQSVSSAEGD